MCQPGGQAQAIGPSEQQNLNAEVKFAPEVLAMNQEYQPAYTQLASTDMMQFLNGSNGQPGYLSEYTNQIAPAATAVQVAGNTAVRAGNLSDVNALIPGMTTATRTANPAAASLVDTMTGNAQSNLNYGTSLNPAERTQIQQGVRAGQAARGVGTGSSDAMQEAFAQSDAGQALYQQRLNNAGQATGQAENLYGGIIPMILGGQGNPSGGNALATMGAGMAAPSMNTEFNPASNMATSFMNNATQVSLDNSAERTGAISKGLGSLGEGMSSGYM